MNTFLCSFTGAIGDMKPRDQGKELMVLAVLFNDADNRIAPPQG